MGTPEEVERAAVMMVWVGLASIISTFQVTRHNF
jgi:hypothetical protein